MMDGILAPMLQVAGHRAMNDSSLQRCLAAHLDEASEFGLEMGTLGFTLYDALLELRSTHLASLSPSAANQVSQCMQAQHSAAQIRLTDAALTTWFEPYVEAWLDETKLNSTTWVQNAIAIDTLVQSGGALIYSSSVVDVFRGLNDIVDVWKQLAWPGDAVWSAGTGRLMGIVCGTALAFANAWQDRLVSSVRCVGALSIPSRGCRTTMTIRAAGTSRRSCAWP